MTLLLPLDGVKQPVAVPRLGCRAHVYVDTVAIWLPTHEYTSPKFAGLVRQLKQANNRTHMGRQRRLFTYRYPQGIRIEINQPTRQVVELIERCGLELCRVHLSVDMDIEDGNRVFRMALMKWRGQEKQKLLENGAYWSSATTKPDPQGRVRLRARNFAYYNDRLSKATGQPCGHFEFRLQRSSALISAGLRKPSALLDDTFDLEKFLIKQLKLRYFGKKWYREQIHLAGKIRSERKTYRKWAIDHIIAHQAEAARRNIQRISQQADYTPHFPTFFDIPAQVIHDHVPHLKELLESP